MPLVRTIQRLGCTIVLAAGTATAIPTTVQAAAACTEAALVDAITAANAAGGGDVALAPNCTYHLTASHATGAQGPDGLPIVTTVISLTGTNTVITRTTALPFRIAEVSSTGSLTLNSVTLDNGDAVGDGGGILNLGAVTLTGSGLTNNTASGDGGGILNLGAVTLTSSALTGNTASGTGGGLSNAAAGTAATFTSSMVSGNTAAGSGGGLYNGVGGTLTTTSTTVTANTSSAAQGGGIAAIDSTATTLTSTPVSANAAALSAGGIFRLGGVMTLTTSPITGNTPNDCLGSSPAVPGCTT
jgi:hypothetical protein